MVSMCSSGARKEPWSLAKPPAEVREGLLREPLKPRTGASRPPPQRVDTGNLQHGVIRDAVEPEPIDRGPNPVRWPRSEANARLALAVLVSEALLAEDDRTPPADGLPENANEVVVLPPPPLGYEG